MAGIDLNKYYQSLISSGYDPVEAAQITAYQYIDNPTGSLTKIKLPPKWYTQEDYYSYSAPDYLAAVSYTGNDPLAIASRDLLLSPDINLSKISEFTRQNYDKLKGTTSGEFYNQLKDLYDQKTAAEKAYEKQTQTHEFVQYGLPDPTVRYGVEEKVVNGKKYIPYAPAVEYINKKYQDYYNKLRATGLEADRAAERTALYREKLTSAVEKKIEASGINPFVEKIAELRKIKK